MFKYFPLLKIKATNFTRIPVLIKTLITSPIVYVVITYFNIIIVLGEGDVSPLFEIDVKGEHFKHKYMYQYVHMTDIYSNQFLSENSPMFKVSLLNFRLFQN